MHLHYAAAAAAEKALSKNGVVLHDTLMLGVRPCVDAAFVSAASAATKVGPIFFVSQKLALKPPSYLEREWGNHPWHTRYPPAAATTYSTQYLRLCCFCCCCFI